MQKQHQLQHAIATPNLIYFNHDLIYSKSKKVLHQAIEHPLYLQQLLLSDNSIDIDSKDQKGRTPLMYASATNNIASLELLINHNANIHMRDNIGLTALHWSVIKNSPNCLMRLLTLGIDIETIDNKGHTAYYYAISLCEPPRIEILKCLIARGCDRTSIDGLMGTGLALAAMTGNTPAIRLLLKLGDDPDEIGHFGKTPLMLAAYGGHISAVIALLGAGADPNRISRMGGVVLQTTMMKLTPTIAFNRHQIIAVLLQHGADPNLVNAQKFSCSVDTSEYRKSTLLLAVHSGYLSIISMLLAAGISCRNYEEEILPFIDPHRFVDCSKIKQLIIEWTKNPKSLSHLCRLVVRKSLVYGRRTSLSLPSAIKMLPVAPVLQSYLGFNELNSVDVQRVELCENDVDIGTTLRGCQYYPDRLDLEDF